MKFRDHREGFDTVMFTGQTGDGDLALELCYSRPKAAAVIELSAENAHALGVWLLEEFPYDPAKAGWSVRSTGDGAFWAAAPPGEAARVGVEMANRAIQYAGRKAGEATVGLFAVNNMAEGEVRRMKREQAELSELLAGLKPRPTLWRRVWNAVKG